MKLKRWIVPLYSLLICTGVFFLAGLTSVIFKNIGVAIIAVIVGSILWQIIPCVASFFYGYKTLKNASHKAWFVIYNALLHSVALVVVSIFSKNAFGFIFAAVIIPVCILPTALGLFIAKKNEQEAEYTAHFEGVTMGDDVS